MIQNPAKSIYQYAPGAVITTTTTAAFNLNDSDWDDVLVGLVVASAGGTSPTLDMVLQNQLADGNWYDVCRWAQQTGNTTAGSQIFMKTGVEGGNVNVGTVGAGTISANSLGIAPGSNVFRLVLTIGGTSPTFTPTVNFYKLSVSRPS